VGQGWQRNIVMDGRPQLPAGLGQRTATRIFQDVEDEIREVIPERDRELVVDDIGVPQRTYNLAFADGSTINVNDKTILISLSEGHAPTADYVRRLREILPTAFPSATFYFRSADMITQILNFGRPAQIDLRVVGRFCRCSFPAQHVMIDFADGLDGLLQLLVIGEPGRTCSTTLWLTFRGEATLRCSGTNNNSAHPRLPVRAHKHWRRLRCTERNPNHCRLRNDDRHRTITQLKRYAEPTVPASPHAA
jgi:hypothetical protein